jgi:HTH-type transcriptional regulator / antitoxin HipB
MEPFGGTIALLPSGRMLLLLPSGYRGGRLLGVRSIRDVAAAVRGRRQDLGLNQAELAKRAGVSRKWISEFEAGKSTVEFGLVLRVLEELGFHLELGTDSDTERAPSNREGTVDLDVLLDGLRRQGRSAAADG